jgi:hypothetical protein
MTTQKKGFSDSVCVTRLFLKNLLFSLDGGNKMATNQPLEMKIDRTFALQLAASQALAAANLMKFKDADNVGLDDLLGTIFQTGGEVALRYASDVDVKNVDANLLAAYEALGSYLRQRGVIQ